MSNKKQKKLTKKEIKKMVKCKHFWREIESNDLGQPTKYKCVHCLLERAIKRNFGAKSYFDQLNSIKTRIKENDQKIDFIRLNPVGTNEKLHIFHLKKENKNLVKLFNF